MSTATQTVADLINEAMDSVETPEADAIARVVYERLDEEQIEHFAIRGIAERVREIASRRRNGRGKGGVSVSARWSETARMQDSGELDFARELARIPVNNGEEMKWLLECTAEDLVGAADVNESQANALMVGAGKFASLAAMLKRKRGAHTVADLSAEKVWGVLHA